jgi:hypothetical protein
MKTILNNILDSFSNDKKGWSGRKLTAFSLVIIVIIVHIKWITLGNFEQLEMVLTIDYTFIAALFGMTTYQSIKENPKTKITLLKKK